MGLVVGAIFFAMAGYVGVLLAEMIHVEPLDDGPPRGEPRIPLLIAASAVLGVAVMAHATSPVHVALAAIVCVALTAIWCTDVRYGIVPDVFTLGPLALVFLIGFWRHDWWLFVSAAVPFAAFAGAAMLSKGRGMGWGDVKLAALGGAILGLEASLVAFSISCLAAALYAYARGQRNVPIAFAPYLIATIAVAIPMTAQV